MKTYFPGMADRCREVLDKTWVEISIVAREYGYALCFHGSGVRDIDIVAAPWVQHAHDAEEMVEALRKKVSELLGDCFFSSKPLPEEKPHGRRAWTLHVHGGVYYDLSIYPLVKSIPNGEES